MEHQVIKWIALWSGGREKTWRILIFSYPLGSKDGCRRVVHFCPFGLIDNSVAIFSMTWATLSLDPKFIKGRYERFRVKGYALIKMFCFKKFLEGIFDGVRYCCAQFG